MTSLQTLRERLLEVYDLQRAADLLHWDLRVYMPSGGVAARGRQTALLSRLAHERFTAADMGKWIDAAERETESLPFESDDASLVRVARRFWELEIKRPSSLVAEFQEHIAKSYQAWTEARPANDFARMVPYLEKTLDLSRRIANCYPGYDHIADPLVNFADYGMKAGTVRSLFAELRSRLLPLVQTIASKPVADNSCLHRRSRLEDQLAFGVQVIRRFGYDFDRGRQDMTRHPFMTKFSLGDVRITTRANEGDLTDSLFSTMHECGHALYEQGIDPTYEGTPLARGTSSGVHESQSRLWENNVGRSHGFWEYSYPLLEAAFPEQLRGVSLDTFYKAINRVERSLIRTDADEVTYNLHVMLRFDLELDLLEGKLAARDLARAWRERFEADFGIPVPNDQNGVLQDVHWYDGRIGGVFQGYTLGNILAAQFYESAVAAHPEIPSETKKGTFGTLLGWLRNHVHRHGAKFTPSELVVRATGRELTIEPYMAYLWGKFGSLYGVEGRSGAEAAAGRGAR